MWLTTLMVSGRLRRLLCRRERDQGCADYHENGHTDQFSTWNHIAQCLSAHDCGVSEAGPCGEGDQAAAGRRIGDGKKQEDTQGDVKAEHHR